MLILLSVYRGWKYQQFFIMRALLSHILLLVYIDNPCPEQEKRNQACPILKAENRVPEVPGVFSGI
jgi:hypothetical protein